MPDAMWMDVGKGDLIGTLAPVTAVDDRITITGHGLSDGEQVVFDNLTGGAAPALRPNVPYWVWNTTADDFQVAPSAGGLVMDFGSDGGADVWRMGALMTATELRRAETALMAPGDGGLATRSGVRPGNVPATISGFTVTVQPCSGLVQASGGNWSATDGPYQWAMLEQPLTVTAADGAQDRIDRLVARIQDNQVDNSGFLRAVPVIVDGIVGSGSAPAVQPGEVSLGTITVAAGGSPAPTLSLSNVFCWALGAVETVADAAALPSTGRYGGQYLDQRDIKTLLRDTGSAREAIASVTNHSYVTWMTEDAQAVGWNVYTPTMAGHGTATFSTLTGRWKRIAPLTVCFIAYFVVSSAGSGSSNVTVTAPTAINRATRQTVEMAVEGASGGSGGNRAGQAVSFTGSTGTAWDRLRMDDGTTPNLNNVTGSQLNAGMNVTIQGWYQEEDA